MLPSQVLSIKERGWLKELLTWASGKRLLLLLLLSFWFGGVCLLSGGVFEATLVPGASEKSQWVWVSHRWFQEAASRRITGCLWAVSLATSLKAEAFCIWKHFNLVCGLHFHLPLFLPPPFSPCLIQEEFGAAKAVLAKTEESSSRRAEPQKRRSREAPCPSQINLSGFLKIVACENFLEGEQVWKACDYWELIYRERRNLFKKGWPQIGREQCMK